MEKIPKISVIVPVYNAEKYLHKCIDSILAQTFTDFELLLINDGSKDNSGKICDEYGEKDKRIRVFHKENGGVSSARNMGLDNAIGEWIYFIDADDSINESLFNILFSIDPSADIVQFGYRKLAKNGTETFYLPHQQKTFCNADHFITKSKFKQFTLWIHFIKHSLIKQNGIIFSEDICYGEDIEFVVKCYLCAKKIITKFKIGYNYFVREDSAMSKAFTLENAKKHLLTAERLAVFYAERDLENDVFLKIQLRYMINSFFSFILKERKELKKISVLDEMSDFRNRNAKVYVLMQLFEEGWLRLVKLSPLLYLYLMKIKASLYKKTL